MRPLVSNPATWRPCLIWKAAYLIFARLGEVGRNQCCKSGSESGSTRSTCFGPHGSGSISQRYGSGYGSDSGFGPFYHQAKTARNTLIPFVLWLFFDFLSLKNDVNVPSKSNMQENFFKLVFCLRLEGAMMKIAGFGSISQSHGSADPDPHQIMSRIRNTGRNHGGRTG